MSSLAGKVAIITGASSGIGAATAVHFSRLGAVLAITGRNAENLAKTARECRESGGQEPLIIGADLVKEEDCVKIISETVDKFGKLDVLVNNAGVLEMGSIENTSLEQYDRVMGTNMRAVYHLTLMAVPHLEVTKGNIVNVSSVNVPNKPKSQSKKAKAQKPKPKSQSPKAKAQNVVRKLSIRIFNLISRQIFYLYFFINNTT